MRKKKIKAKTRRGILKGWIIHLYLRKHMERDWETCKPSSWQCLQLGQGETHVMDTAPSQMYVIHSMLGPTYAEEEER